MGNLIPVQSVLILVSCVIIHVSHYRSLHDALCVLAATVRESRVVYGGGCSEMLMAVAVNAAAAKTPGKEAVAMEAFARALQQLPTVIADNAGYALFINCILEFSRFFLSVSHLYSPIVVAGRELH